MTSAPAPAPGSRIVIATFTAVPGAADEIARMLGDYAASVRAEPGNLVFHAGRRTDDPDAFVVYELYADEAAFQAHLAAPYGPPFNEALAPLIREPRSVLSFADPA